MRLSVHKGQSDVVVCVCEEELEYAALRGGEAIRRHSQGNHVILFFVVSPSVFVLRVEGEIEREKRRVPRALFAILRDFLLLSGEKSLLIVRNGEIES